MNIFICITAYILLTRIAFIFGVGFVYDENQLRKLSTHYEYSDFMVLLWLSGIFLEIAAPIYFCYKVIPKVIYLFLLPIKAGHKAKKKFTEFKMRPERPRIESGQLSPVNNGQLSISQNNHE